MRFQIGHTPEVERMRVPMGKGVVGQVALTRQPMLLNDVTTSENYIDANPDVRSELAVPLIAKNRLIGVMDIESEQAGLLPSRAPAPAHADRLAHRPGHRERAPLRPRLPPGADAEVLNEIAVELTSILDLDPLLERVGQLLRRLIDYQMFTIMLLDEKGETLITRYAWRFGYAHAPMRRLPITSGLVGAAVREWRPVNVPDVRKDPRYLPMNPETRSELIVPLFYKGRIIGVLDLEHTRTGFFNEEHERMLTTLAAQMAIAIENARLYQAVRRRSAQLERDIAMAREVQLRLLPPPRRRIHTPRWRCAFCPRAPSAATSTTFVDYGPDRTAIVLGDVSGKAAPAALFAALVSGIMRSAAQQQPEPAADARPAQRRPPGAQARIAVRHHALRPLERREPDPAGGQLRRRAAHLLPRRRVASPSSAEGFPLGMFPNVDLRGVQRGHRSPATPSSLSPTEFSTPKTPRARCTARSGSPACSAPTATSPPRRSPTPSSPT